MRRLEFQRPILGRLLWGWVAFGAVLTLGAGWIITEQARKPKIGRVALDLDAEIARLTPPPQSLHLSAPETVVPDTAINVTATQTSASVNANKNRGIDETDFASLRYADTTFKGREEQTQSATTATLAAAPSASARQYQFPDENTADTPPGKLVITIDGQNIDDPRIHKTSAEKRRAREPVIKIAEPKQDLLQSSEYGQLPRIAPNGRRASQVYARTYTRKPDQKSLGLIVGGLGLNKDLTERAINELPGSVTLAFAPYAKNLDQWMQAAREQGHEVMLEIPMEGHGGNNAQRIGPAGLLTSHAPSDNLKRLDWVLSRARGYFGVTNYLGSKFSADGDALRPVLARIQGLGLAYIDDTGAARRVASKYRPTGVVADIISPVGSTGDVSALEADLAGLREKAATNGKALGKVSASDAGITILLDYLESFEKDELSLAPASAVLYADGQY